MATSSQEKRSIARKRAGKGLLGAWRLGFWRSLALSACASFGAVSTALQLPWAHELQAQMQAVQNPRQWFEAWLAGLNQVPWESDMPARSGAGTAAATGAANTPNTGRNADFAQCRQFFPDNAIPLVLDRPAASYALCFDAFAILYNAETKTPIYVVERLNRASLQAAQAISRTDRFYPEARLPASARAQLEDYRGSGYSRGHMAPAADMPSEQAMAQSFSLANMVPQNQSHNSGPWSKIEQDTRQYVKRAKGDVFVFTGPVYQEASPVRIGPSAVAVPSHLFKLVYDPTTQRSWAHWQQNQSGEQSLRPISYRELSQRLHIEFLPDRY